jgi:hypothetical protein
MFVSPSSLNNFASKVLVPNQAHALRSLAVWTAIPTQEVPDPEILSWKSWRPSAQIVDGGLLSGIRDLQLSVSVFASLLSQDDRQEWRDFELIGGFMEFGKLKSVGVAVSQVSLGDSALDAKELKEYVDEVKARLLERKGAKTISGRL